MNKVLLEAIVTEAEPPMFEQMLGTAPADFYGHQTPHGSFVFGGHTGMEPYFGEYAGDGLNPSQAISAPTAARAILNFFPRLQNTKLVRTWAGSMDECADKVAGYGPPGGGARPFHRLRLHRTRLRHRTGSRPATERAGVGRQGIHPVP